MSSPFPQLLRRANIATYDPLITRIYTSTPSSNAKHADWGLKFGVKLPKGPRYIKFSSLDAGPGVNCDWRSGEREARFIQAWGNGSVRWSSGDDVPAFSTGVNTRIFDDHFAEPAEEVVGNEIWMRDVESMSEEDFERYLERIREERKKFLSERLESVPESTRQTLVLPEDKTLIHLATSGKTTGGASANFQASLTASDLEDPTSTKLHSKSHRLHGLSYATKPVTSNEYNLASEKKGRVLNKVSRADEAHHRSRALAMSSVKNNNFPLVVSLGGVTGRTTTENRSIIDSNQVSIDETDYTRQQPLQGVGQFKINRAQMSSAPTVLALAEARGRVGGRWRNAAAPSPLDTFNFDIGVTPVSSATDQQYTDEYFGGSSASADSSQAARRSSPPPVGTREWVSRDNAVDGISRQMAETRAGNPRYQRKQGEAQARLRTQEHRADTVDRINRLLAKVKLSNQRAEAQSQGKQ
ncbi:hypothetical protein I316_04681 [Kwoniella heveanensis BCC8398]|uniref:Uncharacterized protein n=1 Tax=Kwoniella heveanensis BCC8398 TaxID=1296120 RepID=A0A1B9GRL0_9TREE|nr:hypothetical protein I316_04681 [Kwoniella heveanensis BCC8398]